MPKTDSWTHTPPCRVQVLLEEMFNSGKISEKTAPKAARSLHTEFLKHTPAVFGNNFRMTKQKYLEECKIFYLYWTMSFLTSMK